MYKKKKKEREKEKKENQKEVPLQSLAGTETNVATKRNPVQHHGGGSGRYSPQGWTDRWKAAGSWGLQYRVLRIGGGGMRERPCLAQLQNWAKGHKGGGGGVFPSKQSPMAWRKRALHLSVILLQE